jgi:hypothetical protein
MIKKKIVCGHCKSDNYAVVYSKIPYIFCLDRCERTIID